MSTAAITRRQLVSLVLFCLAGIALTVVLRNSEPAGADISARTDLSRLQTDDVSPSAGPRAARVALVVFTDYQCAACRAAHPAMLRSAREAGDVRIIYRDLPVFGPISQQAARVALAARNQGLYPKLHYAFMREPRRLDPPVMRRLVEQAGGDWQQINRDLASDPAIAEQLALNRADALKLGVPGTPTYLIGDRLFKGALDGDGFAAAFEQARAS